MISNIVEKIFQNNIYIFVVVILIIFFIMNYIETHIAVGLLVISYIMVNYEDLFSTIKSMESKSVQKEKLIEDNVRTNKGRERTSNKTTPTTLHVLGVLFKTVYNFVSIKFFIN